MASVLLIDRLHKLADNERYALYSLDLFLGSYKLPFQTPKDVCQRSLQVSFSLYHVPLFILDIFFLQVYVSDKRSAGWSSTTSKKFVLKMSLEFLQGGILVAAIVADTFERIYVRY